MENIIESLQKLVENERESHNYPKPRPPSELVRGEPLAEHLKRCGVCRINFNHTNGRISPSQNEFGYFSNHLFSQLTSERRNSSPRKG